jgi:hypothetical protein
MKNKFSIAMSLAMIVAMLVTSFALASDVDVAVVDVIVPATGVTLAPGASGNITINMVVTGNQVGTATFEVYRDWVLSGGTFTGSNPQEFTVAPRAGGDPATTFSTTGTVSVATGQAPGGPFILTVSVFDITNTNTTGAKLTARNTDSYSVTVSAPPPPSDSTAPIITKIITGTAGANGWYTSDVTVAWSVTDAQSAVVIDSGCGTQSFTSETTGTPSSCSAHSAGGSASDSVTIKIDKTAPSAALAVTAGTAGLDGWYTGNVTVSTAGSDSISSPVVCTADQSQTTETTGSEFNGSCINDAGLTTNAAPLTVKLDKTGPSANLSASGTSGDNGWFVDDVTISASGSDAVSGNVTCSADQSQTTETAGAVFNGSCTNGAGLSTNAAPLTVKLDKTGPSASLSAAGTLGNNGWYTSNVTISTSGSDSISSPVSCTAAQSQTSDTTGQIFNGSCTNDAGLSTYAASLTIKRDATKPTLAPSVSPNPVVLNGSATASPNANDATSGVASSSCGSVNTSSVGTYSVNCTATDNAGNTNSASANYSVVYNWSGFFQPVDNTGFNIAKAGQAIPLKWRLTDANGNPVLNLTSVTVTVTSLSCASGLTGDLVEEYAAGSSGLQNLGDGYYQFNWKTPTSYASSCKTMSLNLGDGTPHTALFQFKK